MVVGTELTCLEPKATAKAKLGVNGQWINVQDPKGDQGYVAAWYVSETKGASSPSSSAPASTSTTSTTPKPATSSTLPAGALAFLPIEELSLRSKPVIAPETLIRRIPVTEEVVSIEPAKDVIPKVGVVGQWIKVRDQLNKEGFVAAWYVKYASGSTAQQATAGTPTVAAPAGSATKVKATAQAVAFRKQPVVSDTTLIRWLPLGEVLTVNEPGGDAKIGANNQWLKVKDTGGMEGYVAAWFVAR
jgi:hypothetical protein